MSNDKEMSRRIGNTNETGDLGTRGRLLGVGTAPSRYQGTRTRGRDETRGLLGETRGLLEETRGLLR